MAPHPEVCTELTVSRDISVLTELHARVASVVLGSIDRLTIGLAAAITVCDPLAADALVNSIVSHDGSTSWHGWQI